MSDYPQFEIMDIFEDGFLAVRSALKLKPDLIIMDIGLPGKDGIAATQEIKQQLSAVRVVMLTSHIRWHLGNGGFGKRCGCLLCERIEH